MQDYFHRLADTLGERLRGDEVYLARFAGEDSDFVRFNKSAVRQAGSVAQRTLAIELILGARHAAATIAVSGNLALDRERLASATSTLREQLAFVPDDPHLLYATDIRSTEQHGTNRLPEDRASIIETIVAAGRGHDLVGHYAGGPVYHGFANSLGQRNWFSSYTFNFDWSFYLQGDKAVKAAHAGFDWDAAALARKLASAREQLAVLARAPRTIEPGRYRVYLAPAALAELFGLLAWGGFSLKSQRTKQSPLLRMAEDGALLHDSVTLVENTQDGVAPNFQSAGFVKPPRVTLIERGALRDSLASPRSAREYGVATNGADDYETPDSLDLSAGELPPDDVLRRLDTGVYVNNLWYTNFSDRSACRITGMTRFVTFWVERGAVQAPINVMRFDETLYRMLGENLEGLTSERELILDTGTYGARSVGSARLPGALIRDFTFTL